MKQAKIIHEKQEFDSTIPRFGMYLFKKIKKIFKKLSVNPKIHRHVIFKKILANLKIQGIVFDYALICQFNQFLSFSSFFIHTIYQEEFFFFFCSRLKSRKIEDQDHECNFSFMCSEKIKNLSKMIF